MMENSEISWCHHTFNPWFGCSGVSPGCDNCYAEKLMDHRMHKVKWGAGNPRIRTSPENWRKPLAWNAKHAEFFAEHGCRQRVFCASLGDVFDNAVDPQWRRDLFNLIAQTPNLDWLLLTKRIGNAAAMIEETNFPKNREWPWPNVWLGATIVNQEEADRDIPKLLAVPAAKRFLSMEPLLCSVDISRWLDPTGIHCMDVCLDSSYVKRNDVEIFKNESNEIEPLCPHCGIPASWTGYDEGIDWVIAGGESGPGARPMHPDWPRSLRDQCAAAGVPFHFKQWGEFVPMMGHAEGVPVRGVKFIHPDGTIMGRAGKKDAGRLIDGIRHDGFPEATK